ILSLSMVVIGVNIVMGYAGQLSLGPGGIFAVAAYGGAILALHQSWGGNLAIMMVVGAAAAALSGLIIAVPALRVSGFYLGMTTLLIAAAVPVIASSLNIAGRNEGILLISD